MKNLKLFLLLVATLIGCFGASAASISELNAQNEVKNYLTRQGFSVEIDDEDQSIIFYQQDIMYWITFKSEKGANGILYTLHRRPIKLRGDKDSRDLANRKNEVAVIAANMLNKKMKYKTFVDDCRVDFQFPIYATTPQEYIKLLRDVLESMSDIKKDFTQAYDRSRAIADSIHNFWSVNDTARVILPQAATERPDYKPLGIKVNKVAVGSFNSNGEPIVPYDGILQTPYCKFLGENITITADVPGETVIGLKIYNPQGKFIAPSKESLYTVELPVEIKKNKKEYDFDMPLFGTNNEDFWTPGIYRIEIYENGRLARKDIVFNISK